MQNSTIHVCFDARKIRHGGIGVYIQNALAGLIHNGTKITLLVNEHEPELSKLLQAEVNIQVIRSKPSTLRELFFLASEVDWQGIDIFHTPNYILPFRIPVPRVVTIHDLIHLRYPEQPFYPLIAAPLIYSSIIRANKILAVSRATYGDVKNFLRYFPSFLRQKLTKKIKVISNAISPSFIKRKPIADFVRLKFGIQQPFFLSILSTVKPHKGVKDLLDAFLDLEQRGVLKKNGDPLLVLAGQGTENLLQVERLLNCTDRLRAVRLLGSVSQEELFQLYAAAKALIVPSFIEGFCLPVIEAQAVRTPVITRPTPAVLDLLSPRDLVCRDFSLDGLITGIERFMSQPSESFLSHDVLNEWQEQFLKSFDPYALGYELLKTYSEVLKRKMPTKIQPEYADSINTLSSSDMASAADSRMFGAL